MRPVSSAKVFAVRRNGVSEEEIGMSEPPLMERRDLFAERSLEQLAEV